MFGKSSVWRETEDGKVEVDVCFDTLVLLWLSYRFKLDLRILLFLYQKYGLDVLFFFYLFAGKEVKFPSLNALLKTVKSVQEFLESGKGRGVVYEFLKKLEVSGDGKVEISLDNERFFPLGRLGLMEEGDEGSGI